MMTVPKIFEKQTKAVPKKKNQRQLVAKFFQLILQNQRISIRRIKKETGMSKSTVYRWIKAASEEIPICLDNGIVVCKTFDDLEE